MKSIILVLNGLLLFGLSYLQIHVTCSGDVGIGDITNPKGKLHYKGDLYGKGHVYFHAYEGDGNSGTAYIQARDKSGTSSIGMQFRSQNDGNVVNSLKINSGGELYIPSSCGLRIGGNGTPRKMLDIDGYSYFSCKPANSGFYFENYSTAPIILPQWAHSMYLGRYDRELWVIYTEYLRVQGVWISSDQKIKENIRPITNSLDKITKIQGYNFDYKAEIYQNSFPDKKEELLENRKNNTGFIAQEIIDEFPELVNYNSESELYEIDYIGFIPQLVEAIKEQETIIDNLIHEISELKSESSNNLKSALITNEDNFSEQTDKPILFQNKPNPFNEDTEIKFYLPATVNDARIYLYNMQGSQIKSMIINQKGQGYEIIHGSDLRPGMYMYALIVDGLEIDTKRMILTD